MMLAVVAFPVEGTAQQRQRQRSTRYTPSRPTVSPYLNLFNPAGATPSYQAYVRPEFQQQDVNRIVGRELTKLDRRTQPTTGENGRRTRGAGGGPLPGTGHATAFGDYSHFFPTSQLP
jgi:hypothetical protein